LCSVFGTTKPFHYQRGWYRIPTSLPHPVVSHIGRAGVFVDVLKKAFVWVLRTADAQLHTLPPPPSLFGLYGRPKELLILYSTDQGAEVIAKPGRNARNRHTKEEQDNVEQEQNMGSTDDMYGTCPCLAVHRVWQAKKNCVAWRDAVCLSLPWCVFSRP